MNTLRFSGVVALATASLLIGGCGGGEPALPTSIPGVDLITRNQGWKVEGTIAVDAQNNFYHMQHLVQGYHDIDVKSPPLSIVGVAPKCQIPKPASTDDVHVIIARGGGGQKKLSDAVQSQVGVFSKASVEERALGKMSVMTGENAMEPKYKTPGVRGMGFKDIVVTASENPVFVVVAARYATHYNFTVAPYAKVSGVLVFTESEANAVSGLGADVPVYFMSETSPATKKCWVRVENKPDETWTEHKAVKRKHRKASKDSRYELLIPIYQKFAAKVRRMAGHFNDDQLISVERASYFLIGPAPAMIEQRIPYSTVAGSHIKFMQNDYAKYGTQKEVQRYLQETVNARYAELGGQ